MPSPARQFFIDVGGTFTDVVALRDDGSPATWKLLSSGVIRGVVEAGSTPGCIIDSRRVGDPVGFWIGYTLTVGRRAARITAFDPQTGALSFHPPPEAPPVPGTGYELAAEEEAPVLAVRYLLGVPLSQAIGAVEVRLGTTRATNALLERRGARVALITTKGFADVLKIGCQDRPDLFRLDIRKRDELTETVVEIDERLAADGTVLRSPDKRDVRRQLEELRDAGIQTLAVCLLHAHVNPGHEELIADLAGQIGFDHVSFSSRIARIEKIVPRGDTTVVDAYLAPVIRDYVAALRRSMPDAKITLMTSSGGLVSADAAAGKDTILSGPAGGVLGCRHVARRAGFSRTIGFDMGGTSTDVCRVDPPPADLEYTHETVKAGVRLMTPMLAVETVAAGGGSICAFDGQKLTVGPKSAGADPGPACYGRDGPITITDVNLHLGRVVADHFPFTLDRDVVDRKLAELCELVNKASGTDLTPTTLADGFLQIANATMAAAIKRISMARGFDPAEYALTTFGGAGAQHACDIARLLGIGHVVCSPLAGVLSALGIGVADLKRIREQSVHLPLDDGAAATLRPHFESMTDKLRCELIQQGATDDAVTPPKRTLDLCYAGQSTLLTVPADPIEQAAGRFEEQHTRLYGYAHRSRAIEIRVVRVELSARTPGAADVSPIATVADKPPPAAAHRTTPLMVGGRRRDVPLLLRAELRAGHTWDGPAVVIEETSTIVVADGWRAAVAETGDIIMSIASADDGVAAAEGRDVVDARSTDPVQLELFNNRFAEAARRMGVTLQRTALSVNVKERLDFSCAVFTPDGDLVVNAPHIPVHLGAMADCVKALMEDVPRLAPGDVYVTNDPYRGGSHLNDITVITPLFDEAGRRILFFVASRAHHADIGGTRPGSMPPDSTSLAEEGVLISAFPWFRKGTAREEAMRTLLTSAPHPARKPDENLADIAAQVAANHTGARELRALIDRYGLDVVHAYMKHIQDAAERKMRTALAALPDGVRRFTDSLDDGSLIRLTLTIHGDAATLDFTGTGPVLPGNLNANRAIVKSAALYCFRCLIDSDIPLNAGVLAPLDIILPECLLSPPRHSDPSRCPAVAGGNVETSQRVVDVILGTLGLVAASQGTMNNLLIGRDAARTSGHRLNKPGSRDDPLQDPPAHRLPFGYYETICGGAGAGDGFHGADAVHTHMTNTRLTDPEVLEARVPVRLVRFAIRKGSGGDGRYGGGCGVIREIEFLAPLHVSILSQRRATAPYGLAGGQSGKAGRNVLQRSGSTRTELLAPICHVDVQPGDRLTIETPGGGGWGR